MTKREKIGTVVLLALLAVFALLLVFTVRPLSSHSYTPEKSFFIQQRMRNLAK